MNIIEIKTDLPIDEVMKRLSNEIKPPSLFSKDASLIGIVSSEKILAYKIDTLTGYFDFPVFEGKLQRMDDKTVLKGKWTNLWYSRLLSAITYIIFFFVLVASTYLNPFSITSISLYIGVGLLFFFLRKHWNKRVKEDKEWIIKCFEYMLNS